MMRRTPLSVAVAFVAGVALTALGPALSAAADDSSTTTWSPSASQHVSYGTNWVMPVTVAGTQPYDYVVATSGTVNVLVEGVPGNYVTGIPLAAGGVAFFSPPTARLPLTAGTYTVTAVYVPSGTSGLTGSQTLTPATLTITPVAVSTSFAVNKVTLHGKPGLEAALTVRPPHAGGAIPAGNWRVVAKDAQGTTAFSHTVPLARNPADPVTIDLDQKVKPGRTYTISAEFRPPAGVAGGYKVTNGAVQKVILEPESIGEVLATPFAAPLWVLVGIAIGLALLIAAAIVLFVRRPRTPMVPADEQTTTATVVDAASD